jgi:hypothetical protein
MVRLPPFKKLWDGYPAGGARGVKSSIGGGVNMDWVTNTCTVRMSAAFHHAGHPIPNNFAGLTTTYGADGRRYAFRVSEFGEYLRKKYGRPHVEGKQKALFRGKRGIVQFDLLEDPDADGHMDMWDGRKVKYNDCFDHRYFRNAWLWICP